MSYTLCRDCCELIDGAPDACPACCSDRLVSHAEIAELGIAHIDCDAFYASVEKRDRPELADEPVIIGHAGGRGVVLTACYVARKYGARSAMPMFKALELCPNAIVINPDMAKYKRVSNDIRSIFLTATPTIEPISLDEAYLDLTDAHRIDQRSAAQELARLARRVETEIGITVSIGLGWNKFLAKLASDMQKPRGFSVIGRAETRELLRPLSVRKINGVGEVTAQRLEASGIKTIGELQQMSEMQLVTQYGKLGRRLARFAHGNDDRKVTPDRPTKSISAETTFSRDTGSADELYETARPLCDRVAMQLARKQLAGGTVVLKLKTSDFRVLTRSRRLAHPTQRAEVLAEAALHLIRKDADGTTYRLIGVGVDELGPASAADPPNLFGV
jgi:DNA polymerase-4